MGADRSTVIGTMVPGDSKIGEETKIGTDADGFPLLELDEQLLPGALANGISITAVLLSSWHDSTSWAESLAGAGLPGMVSSHNNDCKLLSASSSHFSASSDFSTGVCTTDTATSTFSSTSSLSDLGNEMLSLFGEELHCTTTALAISVCSVSYNDRNQTLFRDRTNFKTKLM